jgi:hypothetical protein
MDEILAAGRKRDRKLELTLGLLLFGGGVAFKLGLQTLDSGLTVGSYGAIGLGAAMIARAVFRRR